MIDEEKDEKVDLDIRILKWLSGDGRRTKSFLAEELKRSPNTIKAHVEALEEEKIIKSYGVQIDYEKLGYDIMAVIELTISKGKMIDVETELSHFPNIFAVYDITGTYDALLLARFKTRSELSALVKRINSNEFVIRTNTHLILNVIKEESNLNELLDYEKGNLQ